MTTVEDGVQSAWSAWRTRHDWHALRADHLAALATALDDQRDAIITTAAAETALTPAELAPEFARMTGTLRLFADVSRDQRWRRPTTSPASGPAIGPAHDLSACHTPIGPVAVFGASNFPLAYGVCGGDTASALAAGCPVVVKEHPAHPRTGRRLAELAADVLNTHGAQLLGYVPHTDPKDFTIAAEIVRHPAIAGVGFTGSRPGGLALDALARSRERPIPVFAEMGSVNPVFITPAAMAARGPDIADQLAASILQRFGQQCTRPGQLFLDTAGQGARAFIDRLRDHLAHAQPRNMLATWIRDAFEARAAAVALTPGVTTLAESPAGAGPRSSCARLFAADSAALAEHETLREELFGPAAIVVNHACAPHPPAWLPPALTATIYAEPHEWRADAGRLAHALADEYAGRIVINGVPTGVRVADAMVHGGPFPATNRPDTTAVGPRAIERWCRPVCWQNAPHGLLSGDGPG